MKKYMEHHVTSSLGENYKEVHLIYMYWYTELIKILKLEFYFSYHLKSGFSLLLDVTFKNWETMLMVGVDNR